MQLSFDDRTYLVTGGGSGIGKAVAVGLVAAGANVLIVGRNADRRRTVDLNVNGTMYVLKHAARQLVRGGGGSFVGISSIAASNTHRWFGAYGVTKSAVDHLMRLAADELGPSWVRVNGIRPGLIRTDLVAPILDSPELSEDYRSCTPLP
ncbi:MAG: SDR family NAD(P)-dependent oxidoreductase, partial [Mycobacterium sp.]